uniref:Conserved membrane protein n=1 Tax=Rhipicephalus appendiculatus TaxID=34631 RepID=A0A131Z7J4_RHIAP
MCLATLVFFVLNAVSALFSFAWLVILPVCGVAFGSQAFSSLSVAVTASLVARKLIPRLIKQCIPFLELMVTMSALVFPLVYIPPWACQVNLTLLALLDPFFIIIEVFQMLSFVRWCNVKAQTGIDNQPGICKVLVLSFAIASWISSVFILLNVFQGSDTRLLAAFLVLSVLAHVACVYVDTGIISDAALVLLISLLLIRLGPYETKIHETLCTVVQSNHPKAWSGTLLGMLSALPNMTAGAMSRTLSAMGSLTSPLFWIGVLVRVVLVVPALLRLCSLREAGSDNGGASLVRAAATAIGLVAYTQALWRHLDGCRLLHCAPAMTRPAQALLFTLSYTVQALWEQHGRQDDW